MLGEKPHACEYCGKKFRVRGDLKRHWNIHTRANAIRNKKNVSSTVDVQEIVATNGGKLVDNLIGVDASTVDNDIYIEDFVVKEEPPALIHLSQPGK